MGIPNFVRVAADPLAVRAPCTVRGGHLFTGLPGKRPGPGSWKKSFGKFAEASGNSPEASGNLPEASGNLPEASMKS